MKWKMMVFGFLRPRNGINRPANSFLLFVIFLTAVSCEVGKKDDSSWALLPFVKVDSVNPVLLAGQNVFTDPILRQEIKWEEKDVFNPAAVLRNNKIYLLYRAEDSIGKYAGTSRLGLAMSDDGLHFTKMPTPVFYPDNDSMKIYEWEGGAEDPRVVEMEDSTYLLTYTAFDGKLARLCIATSRNLLHWTKQGLAFTGKYRDSWSKSGAVVAKLKEDRIVAQKINGKYWMYFGDTDLFLAYSEDLLHWTPVEENGQLKPVLKPRPGYFDSRLVESGPFALMDDRGILLIYNSMNLDDGGDPAIAKGSYCAGQALFDPSDPSKMLHRLERNFMQPDKPYEQIGQVNQVCFLEGLAHFNGKWFLYYGTADSKIAVAVHEGSAQQ
jgi:beta-1,2-mannosidase